MTDTNSEPPFLNLLVIRSDDIDRAVEFYRSMGLQFNLHSHGKGPAHYAADSAGFVFEIYPKKNQKDDTRRARIGFRVDSVDTLVEKLRALQVTIVTEPTNTEWGRRAVVKDFDGHTVELSTPVNRE